MGSAGIDDVKANGFAAKESAHGGLGDAATTPAARRPDKETLRKLAPRIAKVRAALREK